ncbi:MAG TPA: site-2 protease family protein [Thermoleophilaceae bacterium]|nr:site-2 protease family protein [Thermoleophilaceae bacterium]
MFSGGGSIQLARVFGIRIGVDVSWFLVLFLIIWSLSGYFGDQFPGEDTKAFALAVLGAMLFFASLLLHELGHAVVAIRNGIPISGIDLWMFGGVAKMERDTDSPGVEFRVAAAGPAVTLLIVLVCFAIGAVVSGMGDIWDGSRLRTGQFEATTAVVSVLLSANVFLLLFNLIPGFPLDGGRIARAIVWKLTGDRGRATRVAARLGRFFAFLMIAGGIAIFLITDDVISGVWLAVIGFFLSQAARSAEVQSTVFSRIEGLSVADVMDADPVAIPDELSLERAEDEFFLRYGWAWFPVVDTGGRLVGVVAREALEGVAEPARPGRAVASVMARDADGSGLRVRLEEPLEALLGREGLTRLGALMAVDADGVLRGIVTVDQLRQALRGPAPAV